MDDLNHNSLLEARITDLENRIAELEKKKQINMPQLDDATFKQKLAESRSWIERNPFAAIGIAVFGGMVLSAIF
ncbi:MAG: hypothetical protein Alpg2KO_13220 [Alphaproteobacteria bacterium]